MIFYLCWHLRGNMIVFCENFVYLWGLFAMNKLLHNNTLFTLTLLGIATALAFLFFSFVSENTANIALLYIIAQILIARYTNGYLHGLFSFVFSVICINFFFTYPFSDWISHWAAIRSHLSECWSLHCSPQQPLPLFCLMVPSYQMQKKANFLKILKMTPAGASIWLKIFSV